MKTRKVVFFNDAVDTLSREYQYNKRSTELQDKLKNDKDALADALSKLQLELDVNVFGEDPKTKDEFIFNSERNFGMKCGIWMEDSSYTGLDYILTSYGMESVSATLVPFLERIDKDLNAFKVDWHNASKAIYDLLETFINKLNEDKVGEYYGLYSMPVIIDEEQVRIESAHEALSISSQERKRTKGNHVNHLGFFLTTPREVHSIIHGVYKDNECVYVTYYQDLTFYVKMLSSIHETIETISKLSKEKRSKAYLVDKPTFV